MKLINGVVHLEECIRFYPKTDGIVYTDINNNKIHIPIKLLIRLHEGTKFHYEKNGWNWEEFCDEILKEY